MQYMIQNISLIQTKLCIKYFQIILNNNVYFYLAKIEIAKKLPIGNISVKNSNLTSQNITNFDQSCQLATQKSPIGNILSNLNFG